MTPAQYGYENRLRIPVYVATACGTASMKTKILALSLGIICHLSFCAAVTVMMVALYGSMHINALTLPWGAAIAVNLLLLIQFPVLHSLMLKPSGRAFLSRLVPGETGKHLVTTTYVIAASAQLILLFTLWVHIGTFEWRPSGYLSVAWNGLYGLSWILLAIAMTNAGLGTQMGFLGWTSVYRGEKPVYKTFPQHGLYRICRHPVYFAMILVSITGPVWNIDHLIIASVFVPYCLIGPVMKERRLIRSFGASFSQHMREIPFFPTPLSCWRALRRR
jgi:protein-S-isoprenylcysteine O-methyltransferase Ste14